MTAAPEPSVGPAKAAVELLIARVRLRARLRAAWLRALWHDEAEAGADAAVAAILDDRDSPAAEAAWHAQDQAVAGSWQELAEIDHALAADGTSRLHRLEATFALEPTERDLLHTCVAHALDPALGPLFAWLHDHAARSYVTEPLAARLFGHGRGGLLQPEGGVLLWDLLHRVPAGAGEPAALCCDPWLRDWLLGRPSLAACLVGRACLVAPQDALPEWPVDAVTQAVADALDAGPRQSIRVVVCGPEGAGRRAFATAVAAGVGLPLLVVDTAGLAPDALAVVQRQALRHCFLERQAPAWSGDPAWEGRWPSHLPAFPVQFMLTERPRRAPAAPGVTDLDVELPRPGQATRVALWRRLVPAAAQWPAADVEVLARRYRLTPAGLRGVGARAPATPAAAAACARAASRHGLDGLAQPLEAPFGWDDLVVPERLGDALHDLVYEAEARPALWEEPGARRLFPQGRGLLALFHGPPGTGKTMAAQVVAAALGLELLRIDLARVVSKYVGETSQNLDRILTRAAHLDAVLLWDEADALFGRRTEVKDAQDRFANTDTAYLLQAIEDYPGLALLTSNRRANIDPAFVRRLRFVLEFERPDAAARGRLWARLCDELLGADAARALALDLESLARQLELTGAQIKGALLTARLAARRGGAAPTAEHLLRGVERELNKEGRGLSDRDREGLSHGR